MLSDAIPCEPRKKRDGEFPKPWVDIEREFAGEMVVKKAGEMEFIEHDSCGMLNSEETGEQGDYGESEDYGVIGIAVGDPRLLVRWWSLRADGSLVTVVKHHSERMVSGLGETGRPRVGGSPYRGRLSVNVPTWLGFARDDG